MSADKDSGDKLSSDSEFDDDDDELEDEDSFDFDDDDDEDESGNSKKRALIVGAFLLIIGVTIYLFVSAPEDTSFDAAIDVDPEPVSTERSFTSPEDSTAVAPDPSDLPPKNGTVESEERPVASVEQENMNREVASQEVGNLLTSSENGASPAQNMAEDGGANETEETLPASTGPLSGNEPNPSLSPRETAGESSTFTESSYKVENPDKFTIQVGTFVKKESMNRAKRVLKKLEMEPEESTGKASITRYEVHVGNFQDVEEMQNIVKVLSNDGISVKVKVSGAGKYTLSVLSGFSRSRAYEKKKDLISKGYPAKVKEERKKRTVYILRTGRYSKRVQMKEEIDKLKSKGLDGMVVTLKS